MCSLTLDQPLSRKGSPGHSPGSGVVARRMEMLDTWPLFPHPSGIYIVGGHPINTALKFKPVGWCAPISSYLHGSVHAPKSSYPGIGSVHASKIKDLALGITKNPARHWMMVHTHLDACHLLRFYLCDIWDATGHLKDISVYNKSNLVKPTYALILKPFLVTVQ